jgi:hypothetical protein
MFIHRKGIKPLTWSRAHSIFNFADILSLAYSHSFFVYHAYGTASSDATFLLIFILAYELSIIFCPFDISTPFLRFAFRKIVDVHSL